MAECTGAAECCLPLERHRKHSFLPPLPSSPPFLPPSLPSSLLRLHPFLPSPPFLPATLLHALALTSFMYSRSDMQRPYLSSSQLLSRLKHAPPGAHSHPWSWSFLRGLRWPRCR